MNFAVRRQWGRPVREMLLAGSAILAALVPHMACAQATGAPVSPAGNDAPPASDSQASGPNGSSGIADIVVTAQRRSESLQNVPIAVTAVTSAMLQVHGVQSTEDLAAAIPSLTVQSTAGYLQPRIRGIGNNVFGAGYESGVATYIDGVYIAAAPSTLLSLNNVERVEVLKGPQGTLFGRNATGGLIQIITKEPSETSGGTIAFTGANYGTYTTDAYVTGGLADGVAADFSGHVSTQRKGYGTNLANGEDVNKTDEDINLRSSLLFHPTDGTKIRISGDYEKNKGSVYGAVQIAPGTGAPFPHVPVSTWDVDTDVQPYNRLEAGGISAKVDQDVGFANLTSITAYRKSHYQIIFDGDLTPTPAVEINNTEKDKQFSQELQLTSKPSSPIKWVTGLYYFHGASQWAPSEVDLFGPLRKATPIGTVAGTQTFSRLKTDAIAGYAQATVPIVTDTNLTLGARYTTEKRSISADQFTLLATGAVVPGAPVEPQSKRFSKPTWRASLDHRFSPDLMAYASYNRGFKSGGFNGQFPSAPAFKPEKLDAFEVGLKSDLLDRHVRIDGAAFYYDYTNIQVSRFIGSQISYYNGASAHVYGIDADAEWKVNQRLNFTGGFTLLHDRFTSFPNAVISTQIPTGIIVTTGSATGNRLPQTPDFTATISADYHVPVSFGEIGIDASYSYNDGFFTQPDNILRQPAYSFVTAGARVTLKDGLSLRLWGRNLTNAKIETTLAAGTLDSNISYQAPRTYGATLSAKF